MELGQRIDKLKQKQKGFTLVELIVVIAIIGILAGVMLPRYFSFSNDARTGVAVSEAKAIRSLAENFYASHGSWPIIADGSENFIVGDAANSPTFTGKITKKNADDTNPLEDGSFKYSKNGQSATCDADGVVTGD